MAINHKKLSRLYVILIGSVVLFSISSQLILYYGLRQKNADGRLINLAGRQRMLSQKLTKEALIIQSGNSASPEFEEELELWNEVHHALLNGSEALNIPKVDQENIQIYLAAINPVQKQLYRSFRQYFLKPSKAGLDRILALEPVFLSKMDSTVLAYELNARQKMDKLLIAEILTWALALLIILLEVLFIFRPSLETLKLEQERLDKISFIYAHTLRGPLTNIMTLINLLDKSKLEEERNTYLELLQESAHNFDETVHEVIDLSKELLKK